MHFRSRTKRLASLDLFLNDFKITLGGEGNVFLKSPRYVSGSTRNGEFVDNQRGFPGVIFGFPVPAFLNRGRFLIGAPVPSVCPHLAAGMKMHHILPPAVCRLDRMHNKAFFG